MTPMPSSTPVRGSVLVVDDHPTNRAGLRSLFEIDGFEVLEADSVDRARDVLAHRLVDLVVLASPTGVGGLDAVRAIRAGGRVPLIWVGGLDPASRVRALYDGADDVLAPPIAETELLARTTAVLRRCDSTASLQRLDMDGLELDLAAREVSVDGRPARFTAKEFDLLAFLAARPGMVFTRHQLLLAVWRSDSAWQGTATVTEHIRRIRTKIEVDPLLPQWIVTCRGVGYRFDRRRRQPIGGAAGVTGSPLASARAR